MLITERTITEEQANKYKSKNKLKPHWAYFATVIKDIFGKKRMIIYPDGCKKIPFLSAEVPHEEFLAFYTDANAEIITFRSHHNHDEVKICG